jgi:leucyl aminopeptidase
MSLTFLTAKTMPRNAETVGVPVGTSGPVPRSLGLNRAALEELGFEGKVGQTLVVPSAAATTVVVGIGEPGEVTPATLRTAAAALARAAAKRRSLATSLADVAGVDPREAAQAVVEGLVLGSYRFLAHKSSNGNGRAALEHVTLVAADPTRLDAAIARGQATAGAVTLARDLANTPPGHLTATGLAAKALELGKGSSLQVEVLEEDDIAQLRLGGLLGVNQGSEEPPRMVKLTYSPRSARGTVALVGKGVMYDSGGISLKPSDAMHASMKMDMTGAAVVLATMSALAVTKPKVRVVGYLMCTDNMPSGKAMKLGDVLTIRNGKTVEIHNTDAEGRLILADGLSLAVEEGVDAIVDIATLTGAAMAALGTKIAAVMGNNDSWVGEVEDAAARSDEKVWRLPLPPEYRKLLDSEVADMKNVGGPYAGALTAGLFLQEFVGQVPWAHLDIAGPMRSDADEGWLSKGATGFGVRLLLELLDRYETPVS